MMISSAIRSGSRKRFRRCSKGQTVRFDVFENGARGCGMGSLSYHRSCEIASSLSGGAAPGGSRLDLVPAVPPLYSGCGGA